LKRYFDIPKDHFEVITERFPSFITPNLTPFAVALESYQFLSSSIISGCTKNSLNLFGRFSYRYRDVEKRVEPEQRTCDAAVILLPFNHNRNSSSWGIGN
jgi:hypothetical protein